MYIASSEMERRRGVRFEIQLRSRLKRRGTGEAIDVMTLNLGRLGALVASGTNNYIDARLIPQPGDIVQLEVALPVRREFGQRCLTCDAVTVRATSTGGTCLVALQFERVKIRRVMAEVAAASSLVVM
jgi:hypothetical protein